MKVTIRLIIVGIGLMFLMNIMFNGVPIVQNQAGKALAGVHK